MSDDPTPPTYRPQTGAPSRFYRNKRDGKVLGVCAGIADYAGIDVTLVRIAFVAATVLTGGMTLPVYLVAGLLAPDRPDGEQRPELRDEPPSAYGYAAPPQAAAAPAAAPRHTSFYRDKANGKVMGVCAGIANYTGLDVSLVRVCMVAGLFITGGALIPAYLIAGMITPDKPQGFEAQDDPAHKQFWQRVRVSPARAARDLKSRMREIDRRLADIEAYVTSDNRTLAREIEQLR